MTVYGFMEGEWQPPKDVRIVPCGCGSPTCKRYGLSEGVFYQGSGWDKQTAQFFAAAPDLLFALQQVIRDLPTNRDWLDPNIEAFAKAAIAAATGSRG